jgi:hypothetical protein
MEREDMPPVGEHPIKATMVVVDKSYYDKLIADWCEMRNLLANAYTVRPLEWVKREMQYFDWTARAISGTIEIAVETTSAEGDPIEWCWWYRLHEDADSFNFSCDSLEDGVAKAEAWHHARITAPLVKVEVPS